MSIDLIAPLGSVVWRAGGVRVLTNAFPFAAYELGVDKVAFNIRSLELISQGFTSCVGERDALALLQFQLSRYPLTELVMVYEKTAHNWLYIQYRL